MAITYSQDISADQLNTTSNNSVIKFTSGIVGTLIRADITISGELFQITPNPSGVFTFNFKEAISRIVNTNNFLDDLDDTVAGFIFNNAGHYINASVDIEIFTDVATSDSDTKDFRFKKGVRQLEQTLTGEDLEPIFDILLPKFEEETYAYYLEGEPFDVSFYYKNTSLSVSIENLTNSDTENVLFTEGVNRLFFEKSEGSIFTLSLDDGWNRLEITVAGVAEPFYLNIFKEAPNCNLLVKWFNDEGGWAYHNFNHELVAEDSKIIDLWNRNHNNQTLVPQPYQPTGYTETQTNQFTAFRLSQQQILPLRSLLRSPAVYRRFEESIWIPTRTSGDGITPSKTGKRVFDLQIAFFEPLETQTL